MKIILKTTAFLLLSLAVAVVPGVALGAYNNVTYPAATTVVLTGPNPNITLTISADANVNSILVYPNSIQVSLERDGGGVSGITLTSADKYNLSNDGSFAITCGASSSSVTLTGPATETTATYTVTPSLTTCGGGSGASGGGGGSSSPAPTPTPTPDPVTEEADEEEATEEDVADEATETEEEAEATTDTPAPAARPSIPASGLSEVQVDSILNVLRSFDVDSSVIATVEAILWGTTAPATPATPSTISGVPAGYAFGVNLSMGMSGEAVRNLQIALNSDSATRIASTGPGSPGNETNFYGQLTAAAVSKFQEKHASDVLTPGGLTRGTGFFGPSSRAKLNALLGQ